MEGREFLFNGSWEKFYVKEHNRCIEVVAAMAERVAFWDRFPVVDVILKNGLYYTLNDGTHISLAHYFMNSFLRCNLREDDKIIPFNTEEHFPVRDSKLISIDDSNGEYDASRLRDALSYFPRDSARRFCLKYNIKF